MAILPALITEFASVEASAFPGKVTIAKAPLDHGSPPQSTQDLANFDVSLV